MVTVSTILCEISVRSDATSETLDLVEARNTIDASGKSPRKSAPRRRRVPKAKTTDSDNVSTTESNVFETTPVTVPAPTKPERKRAAPRSKSCLLCARCPCTLRDRDSSGPVVTDFAQSDAAIEKALMKRLIKLEETTDLYDEQTDAVRRRLKKHRRDIWKKREALLKRYDERAAKRNGANATASSSRFLPDVDELKQLDLVRGRKKQRTGKAVAKVQMAVFASTAKSAAIQPTLTQLFGGNEDSADEMNEDNATGVLKTVPEGDEDSLQHGDQDGDENDESSVEAYCHPQLGEIASPVVRVEPAKRNKSDSLSNNAERCSIWDAVRHGSYTSAWDRLFCDESEDLGVDHLLGLFGASQDADNMSLSAEQDIPDLSQSSLSTRGTSLADAVKCRVLADETLRLAIDHVCPEWQENVEFAMSHKVGTNVSEALQNVLEAKSRLQRVKLEISRRIEQQEAVLGVFEESLEQSLTRFATSATSSLPAQPSEIIIPARSTGLASQSVESEIRTVNSLSPTIRGVSAGTKHRNVADNCADRIMPACKQICVASQ